MREQFYKMRRREAQVVVREQFNKMRRREAQVVVREHVLQDEAEGGPKLP